MCCAKNACKVINRRPINVMNIIFFQHRDIVFIPNRGCVYTRPESAFARGSLVSPHVRGVTLDCRSCRACYRGSRQAWSGCHPLAAVELWSCCTFLAVCQLDINGTSQTGSLAHSPSSLLARYLGVLAIVLIRVLNRCHTVDCWCPLELDVFPLGACLCGRVLLENALRGAGVGVGIAWHLQGRESLACWACC